MGNKNNSLKHIDALIAEKKKCIKDKDVCEYIELCFIRSTMVAENIAVAVKESFDQVTKEYSKRFEVLTQEYSKRFDAIASELQGLRKDLGYSNGN